MSELFRKLGWLTRRRRKEMELQEELEFHLREDAAEREAAGLKGEEAITAAQRELGNVTLCMEETRAMWDGHRSSSSGKTCVTRRGCRGRLPDSRQRTMEERFG